MQKAILCVLILILVVLAPWLLVPIIALFAAFFTAYGALMVVALGLLVVVGIALLLIRKPKTSEESLRDRNKEFNRKYREQAKKDELAREGREAASMGQTENCVTHVEVELPKEPAPHSSRMVKCPHCEEPISKHGLWCPKCGKDPKLIQKPTT